MTIAVKFIGTFNSEQSVSQISRLGIKSRAKRWLFSGFALTMLQNIQKNLFLKSCGVLELPTESRWNFLSGLC